MSELRELTDKELDAVAGGVLNNFALANVFNNVNSIVGAQIGQQSNLFSLNGIGVIS
jgi:bacteriocin-like protein